MAVNLLFGENQRFVTKFSWEYPGFRGIKGEGGGYGPGGNFERRCPTSE